jgi:radical SAM superfamily enzyme YgiQ (UPF0313 family)
MATQTPETVLLLNTRRASPLPGGNASDFLGVFYLAAVLENAGYDPWVFHGNSHLVPEMLAREHERRKVVAVGFSCDFENLSTVEDLSAFIKEQYGWPVLVGGPQAVALDQDFFERSGCDYVVRGEAEETLPQLLDYVLRGRGDREKIKGISWWSPENGLMRVADREPIADLDLLPMPAYHRSLHQGRMYGRSLFTGRGCPFSCAFCYESTHKKRVRLRSLDKVMQEIKRNLDTYPDLNYFTLLDDAFTLDHKRVEAFCKEMAGLQVGRKLGWYCEAHVKTLAKWPEMIPMMVDAGLVRMQIGVESGSQEVLDKYNKGITLDQIEFVVERAAQAGLPQLATNLIIGGPAESEETVTATADFAEKLLRLAPGVIDILTGFLRPYPCTAISRDPASFGLKIVDPGSAKSCDDYPVMTSDGLSLEDIISHRQLVSDRISRVMQGLVADNKVPFRTILTQYENAKDFSLFSMWYAQAFKRGPFLDEYFRLISGGAARRFADVPKGDLPEWRPQRTLEMRKAVNFEQGYPRVGDQVLSPLEMELLLRCSGKLTYREVLNELFGEFGNRFSTRQGFNATIDDMIRSFDQRYWVVFCEL